MALLEVQAIGKTTRVTAALEQGQLLCDVVGPLDLATTRTRT